MTKHQAKAVRGFIRATRHLLMNLEWMENETDSAREILAGTSAESLLGQLAHRIVTIQESMDEIEALRTPLEYLLPDEEPL